LCVVEDVSSREEIYFECVALLRFWRGQTKISSQPSGKIASSINDL
jgi:hypothetical protein